MLTRQRVRHCFPEAGTEKRRNGKACEQSPQLPDERIAKIATAGFRLDARLMYLSFFEAGGRFTRALLRRPRQDFKSSDGASDGAMNAAVLAAAGP
jgi:hypothetical protein